MQADSTPAAAIAERVALARRIAAKGDLVMAFRRDDNHPAAFLAEHDRDTLRRELAALPPIDLDTLTDAQIDGLSCVACGISYLDRGAPAAVAVGRTPRDGQVFACWPRCPADLAPCPDLG